MTTMKYLGYYNIVMMPERTALTGRSGHSALTHHPSPLQRVTGHNRKMFSMGRIQTAT